LTGIERGLTNRPEGEDCVSLRLPSVGDKGQVKKSISKRQDQVSFEKRDLPATFIAFTMYRIVHVHLTKVQPHLSILVIFSTALFLEFHFLLVSSQGYLSNKISFISIEVSLQKLSKF